MLYLHKYLTNFQKLSFCCKTWNVAIVVENCKGSGILVLQWQRYNFSNIQKMYKFQFFPLDSPPEMLYLHKYLTNFQKTFFAWKMMNVAIVSEKFKGSRILVLQ